MDIITLQYDNAININIFPILNSKRRTLSSSIHCPHNPRQPSNPCIQHQEPRIRVSRAPRRRIHQSTPKAHQDEGLRWVPWVSVAFTFNNNRNPTPRRARYPTKIDRTRGMFSIQIKVLI